METIRWPRLASSAGGLLFFSLVPSSLLQFVSNHVCLLLLSAVLWESESGVAGTILLTPSFPFPWQPRPLCQFHPLWLSLRLHLHFTPPSYPLYGYTFKLSLLLSTQTKPTPKICELPVCLHSQTMVALHGVSHLIDTLLLSIFPESADSASSQFLWNTSKSSRTPHRKLKYDTHMWILNLTRSLHEILIKA